MPGLKIYILCDLPTETITIKDKTTTKNIKFRTCTAVNIEKTKIICKFVVKMREEGIKTYYNAIYTAHHLRFSLRDLKRQRDWTQYFLY